jgi:excisionase family DNA binding protein
MARASKGTFDPNRTEHRPQFATVAARQPTSTARDPHQPPPHGGRAYAWPSGCKGTILSRPLLTTHEVAELVKVKEATVRQWIRDGELPAVHLHREWRVSMKHMEEFVTARLTTNRSAEAQAASASPSHERLIWYRLSLVTLVITLARAFVRRNVGMASRLRLSAAAVLPLRL